MPPKVGAVKRMHQGQAYQYSLFLTVGKTGRLDKGRLCGCAIGQDFQSRSCLHTIFATEMMTTSPETIPKKSGKP